MAAQSAQQGPSQTYGQENTTTVTSSSDNKSTFLIAGVALLIVLVAGGISWYFLSNTPTQEPTSEPEQEQTNSGTSQTPVGRSPQSPTDILTQTQTITLRGVDSRTEFGKVTRQINVGSISWTVDVAASSVGIPENNTLQAWIGPADEESVYARLGTPLERQPDGTYRIEVSKELEAPKTYADPLLNYVAISIEGTSDPFIESIIAKGQFTEE